MSEAVLVRVLDGPAAGELLPLDRCPDCGTAPDGFGIAGYGVVGGFWYRVVEDDANPGEYVALMIEPTA